MFDINALCNLIDLYIYMPSRTVDNGHISPNMHYIMSGNIRNKASAETSNASIPEIKLRRACEFMWIRIEERFGSFSAAFRFFDANFNNRIGFNEF